MIVEHDFIPSWQARSIDSTSLGRNRVAVAEVATDDPAFKGSVRVGDTGTNPTIGHGRVSVSMYGHAPTDVQDGPRRRTASRREKEQGKGAAGEEQG